MIGEDEVGGFAEEQVAVDLDAELAQGLDLLDQADRIDDDAVADDAGLAPAQDAGGDEVQHIFLPFEVDGVAGVVAALRANDHVRLLGQHVNDFAFAFVAPLGAHQYCIGHMVTENPRTHIRGQACQLLRAETKKPYGCCQPWINRRN